eukprot:284819819_6
MFERASCAREERRYDASIRPYSPDKTHRAAVDSYLPLEHKVLPPYITQCLLESHITYNMTGRPPPS